MLAASRVDVAPQRERRPVRERHEVVGRDDRDLVAVPLQVELAHDLRGHQRDDVRRARDPVAGPGLLGRRGAAEHVAFLQDEHIQTGLRKVRCAREAVVASPDDDDVAFEHAHGSARVPGARSAPQRRTSRPVPREPSSAARDRPVGVSSAAVNSLQRRGLVNGAIAAVATFAIGSAVVSRPAGTTTSPRRPPSPSPTASPTPRPAPPPGRSSGAPNPGEAPTTLLGVAAVTPRRRGRSAGSASPRSPTAVAIQRWDGTTWTAVEGPSPGTAAERAPVAVDASEPNDVWAVGRTSSGSGDAAARPALRRDRAGPRSSSRTRSTAC